MAMPIMPTRREILEAFIPDSDDQTIVEYKVKNARELVVRTSSGVIALLTSARAKTIGWDFAVVVNRVKALAAPWSPEA